MAIADMHLEFKERFDKIDSTQNPNLDPEEIDIFLNIAQQELFSELFKEGAERTQKEHDYLKNLISNFTTNTFTTTASNKPNGKFVLLPTDYKRALQENATVTYTDCKDHTASNYVNVYPKTHGEYNEARLDPFNKPNKNKVIRLSTYKSGNNETFELIGGTGIIITDYHLRYYREPVTMRYGTHYVPATTDVDCELSIEAQRDIVERAVILASKATENYQKYQVETDNIKTVQVIRN